jgi:excisionase family DNA binding protein
MILSPSDKRRSIGLTEAAERLGIATRTLRRHAFEGVIPGAFRIGNRRSHWRIRIDLLESWFERQGDGKGMDDRDDATLTISAGASPIATVGT